VHCDYTFNTLEATIGSSLDSINIHLIRKYFRKMREILAAYRDGITIGIGMQNALKKHKSHRKVHALET